LIGTGLLAIPTLAGSAAYAFAETFDWAYGLDQRFKRAPSFYAVFIFATLAAVAIDFVGVNPIKALFWSAVVNGLLAPPVLVCMYLVANDRKIMVGQPSPRIVNIGVALTAVLMTAAAVCMFIF
jgi:Mn2+/Fe2+ NRAMP family transporter